MIFIENLHFLLLIFKFLFIYIYKSCWSSAMWFWMEYHNYGGWCMPEAAWPSYSTCNDKCPDGPSSCSESVCT